ncbi:2-C-methyl-D-erythritol 2,4-cyclodiphosphate synthase [Candidatus Fermentibacteria bacterium]|nr:2-C-methyl-D-erythritol 2,4-cyclodiphosphate synthase [Candidatus Fermentibacteria bacterium]
MRIGCGYDIHRLIEGRPLVLGGVHIPWPRGPQAHSDGDVICHAAADALLGAAALGDIGAHFPPEDPAWAGANSLALLRHVRDLLSLAGYAVVNLDVMVILEEPRIGPYVQAMRRALAGALDIEDGAVSVKATSNEGLGPVGRGEGLAAWVVVLLCDSAADQGERPERID